MKSPAHDLALYLESLGIADFAGNSGWTLNASREPVQPEKAVTLFDTGGLEPDTVELDLLRPTIQVRVRCFDYEEAFNKQEQIRDALILPGGIVTANSTFVLIDQSSDIANIGRDDNDRQILVANYRTIRQRS